MAPKYTLTHLDILSQLNDTLSKHPSLGDYEEDKSWLNNTKMALINDGGDYTKSKQFIASRNATGMDSGSGIQAIFPKFEEEETQDIPTALEDCHDIIKTILDDKDVIKNDRPLKTYLNFTNLFFNYANASEKEISALFSDPATSLAYACFNTFMALPTNEQLNQLREKNPEAYQAGQYMLDYLDAYQELYSLPLSGDPKKTPEENRQEQIRKLAKLQTAAQNMSQVNPEAWSPFFEICGRAEGAYGAFNNIARHKSQGLNAVANQLGQQIHLLEQGVSLEESRFLHAYALAFKDIKGNLFGSGVSLDKTLEPLKTPLLELDAMAKECDEHFKNGFRSTEDKLAFFKKLGNKTEEYLNAAKNTTVTINPNDPEELKERIIDTRQARSKFSVLYADPCALFNHAVRLKDRSVTVEITDNWKNRTKMTSCFLALKETKSGQLGPRDGEEYRDYQEMMTSFKTVSKISLKKNPSTEEIDELHDQYNALNQKGESYLSRILNDPAISQNPQRLERSKERAAAVLSVLHITNPEKAETLKQQSEALFGQPMTWNQIDTLVINSQNKSPNYSRYYQLHTGENVQNIPDKNLAEYAAKAVVAFSYIDNPYQKFSVDTIHKYTDVMLKDANFQAAMQAAGPEKIKETLLQGDPSALVKLTIGKTEERYHLDDQAKQKLSALAGKMNTDHRSKEWKALKDSLINAKNSKKVFTAIENYVKGKKSVTTNQQRKESVDLALDALAIVASSGDNVAKARANILINRFNEVRNADRNPQNKVDLANYGKSNAGELLPQNQLH